MVPAPKRLETAPVTGPFTGVKVLDMTGMGPGPYCAQMLGDLGADVIRVERPAPARFKEPHKFVPHRSRRSLVIDVRTAAGRDLILRFVDSLDVLLEGNRPGVMERLGLGPDVCLARNERLVYTRITGWGQTGPMAGDVGHDINYISMVGALDAFRRPNGRPMIPLNLVADYGGGGMLAAFGVATALFERAQSGKGQVVDAAMVDGVASQMVLMMAFRAMGRWEEPGHNANDTGAPYYDTYETADGRYLAVGAMEPKFYAALIEGMGLAERPDLPAQNDRSHWPEMKRLFEEIFASKSMAEWLAIFEGKEVCVTPVLTDDETVVDVHLRQRGTWIEHGDVIQPGVAPRFSRTPGALDRPGPAHDEHTDEVLGELGLGVDEIAELRRSGAVA